MLGYAFRRGQQVRQSAPLFHHDYPVQDRDAWLSFADLMESRFLDAFRDAGVSWASIRTAAMRASEILGADHPFSSREFKTDGKTIMTEIATSSSDRELIDLVKDQVALRRVVGPYLYRGLEFGPRGAVRQWWPEGGRRKIVLDPDRAFGAPIVAKSGVPTKAIYEAVQVEQSVDAVAWQFEVPRSSVIAAVEFEEQLAA
jgi:uncharacterized protein (DUF433 family)